MSEKNPTPVENAKGESAAVPPPEPPAVTGPQPEEATATVSSRHDSKEVTVKVVSPFWTTAFNFTTEDGDTLSIDRAGVAVPRGVLEALFEAARNSGIALTEVSE